MYIPGQALPEEISLIVKKVIESLEFKQQLKSEVRLQLDARENKYAGAMPTYASKKAKINLNSRASISGNDVYARTILAGNTGTSNDNVYKRMKNQLHTGNRQNYLNQGNRKIVSP